MVHTAFDLLAWVAAMISGFLAQRYFKIRSRVAFDFDAHPAYFICLGCGAILGGFLFGTINIQLGTAPGLDRFNLGHSSAGAILGAIVGVELYKRVIGLRASTGLIFVIPIAIGLMIGRIGCFLSGLEDHTYGIPTSLPWGVDFGDGVFRHPVQIYESLLMFAFLLWFIPKLMQNKRLIIERGFHVFLLFYALQRFALEFLKPYKTLAFGMNIFHFLMLIMAIYSILMLMRLREPPA